VKLPDDHPEVQIQRARDLRYALNRRGNPAPVLATDGMCKIAGPGVDRIRILAIPSGATLELNGELGRVVMPKAPAPPAGEVEFPVAGQWREGAPPHPWDSEWFLAETTDGHYAVLRPLPEDFTYDFTTVDETYLMRHKIKRWAQLSDSDYVQPEAESVPPAGGEVEVLGYQVTRLEPTGVARLDRPMLSKVSDWGPAFTVIELVDRAHVTRLQAAIAKRDEKAEQLIASADRHHLQWVNACAEREALKAEVSELTNNMNNWMACAAKRLQMWTDSQSELTKARELSEERRELLDLVRDEDGINYTNKLKARIASALAHESSPAAKGGE
jgi:hypothetical protein